MIARLIAGTLAAATLSACDLIESAARLGAHSGSEPYILHEPVSYAAPTWIESAETPRQIVVSVTEIRVAPADAFIAEVYLQADDPDRPTALARLDELTEALALAVTRLGGSVRYESLGRQIEDICDPNTDGGRYNGVMCELLGYEARHQVVIEGPINHLEAFEEAIADIGALEVHVWKTSSDLEPTRLAAIEDATRRADSYAQSVARARGEMLGEQLGADLRLAPHPDGRNSFAPRAGRGVTIDENAYRTVRVELRAVFALAEDEA